MAVESIPNIESTRNTSKQIDFYDALATFIREADCDDLAKMRAFPVFTPRQVITAFLERYEMFKKVVEVPGNIVECGVGSGMGLMAFAHCCSIFEPFHYVRRVIGFDTFEGFTDISEADRGSGAAHMVEGGLNFGGFERIKRAIEIHDQNRPIGHLPKIEVHKGDISRTLPEYLDTHPSTVIGLLYLDLDLYRPTKNVLEVALERIPKGGIVCFDELNHPDYPGETVAVLETIGLKNLRLRRLPFSSMLSYAVIGE